MGSSGARRTGGLPGVHDARIRPEIQAADQVVTAGGQRAHLDRVRRVDAGDLALAQPLRGDAVSDGQRALTGESHQPQGAWRDGLAPGRLAVRAQEAAAADVPGRLAGLRIDGLPRITHEYILLWRRRETTVFGVLRGLAARAHQRLRSTWRAIVHLCLMQLGGQAELATLYEAVRGAAADRCEANPHWQAKVRQVLNRSEQWFESPGRGVWRLKAA